MFEDKNRTIQYCTVRYDTIRYDTIRYDNSKFEITSHDWVCSYRKFTENLTENLLWYCRVRYGTVPYRTVWCRNSKYFLCSTLIILSTGCTDTVQLYRIIAVLIYFEKMENMYVWTLYMNIESCFVHMYVRTEVRKSVCEKLFDMYRTVLVPYV